MYVCVYVQLKSKLYILKIKNCYTIYGYLKKQITYYTTGKFTSRNYFNLK